jgi:hypothetical protein
MVNGVGASEPDEGHFSAANDTTVTHPFSVHMFIGITAAEKVTPWVSKLIPYMSMVVTTNETT